MNKSGDRKKPITWNNTYQLHSKPIQYLKPGQEVLVEIDNSTFSAVVDMTICVENKTLEDVIRHILCSNYSLVGKIVCLSIIFLDKSGNWRIIHDVRKPTEAEIKEWYQSFHHDLPPVPIPCDTPIDYR